MKNQEIISAIETILTGIDKTEEDGGWWETPQGADFGKSRLKDPKHYIENLTITNINKDTIVPCEHLWESVGMDGSNTLFKCVKCGLED